jgi:glutamine synthetase
MNMNDYTTADILTFVEQNDVKFIRLAFCDVFGRMKNIAILPKELKRAFKYGIPFDASAYFGKDYITGHELRLFPIENTLSLMPWRPKTGSVIRLLCIIKENDGTLFEQCQRHRLSTYLDEIHAKGYLCDVNTECEFYLFDRDDSGNPTKVPYDTASYMDTSPLDKCENIRREICITLEEMGLSPETSRHKYGCGQNEIDFEKADVLSCADNFAQFRVAVKTIAYQNGLFCSFLPKPLNDNYYNSLLINLSVTKDGKNIFNLVDGKLNPIGEYFMAGIMDRLPEITAFLNANTNSYRRLNQIKQDNSFPDLFRLQPQKDLQRVALCSPDAMCNIYTALNLVLRAGIEGIELQKDIENVACKSFSDLPSSFEEALKLAYTSEFVKSAVGDETLEELFNSLDGVIKEYNNTKDKQAFEDTTYTEYYG